MDYAACHVIYLDKRVRKDRYEQRDPGATTQQWKQSLYDEPDELQRNLKTLMSTFHAVHMCSSGLTCLSKIRELEAITTDCTPTIIFLEINTNCENDKNLQSTHQCSRTHPTQTPGVDSIAHPGGPSSPEDFHGLMLLRHIASEISHANLSKLTVPIATIRDMQNVATRGGNSSDMIDDERQPSKPPNINKGLSNLRNQTDSHGISSDNTADISIIMRCLETGAVDVVTSPFVKDRIQSLAIHGFRAHIEGSKEQPSFVAMKSLRKRSWVGIDEEKPYAYLRESMVSTLMNSICKPESIAVKPDHFNLYIIDPSREAVIAQSIGSWAFAAHDLSDDELVHAAFLMLQHALDMPDLEKWRIPADELKRFLMACRSAYNSFVLYHNFRHVIDVLQAVFFFLLQIGILPPYLSGTVTSPPEEHVSPIAKLLKPFEALILLVSAIGHDVGHPGVNNAFLVALKAPLAQLYNDNSVLEAFHCAAYSQILRRHWAVVFEDTDLRRLLIKSILATDMQVHFRYMTDLGNLQEKLHHDKGIDGWSDKVLEEYRTLICGLLIKCADISNVARPFKIASKWSDILQLEFAKQGEMERDVGIPTTLFGGPPELGNLTKLAISQISFMNIFACPLFESVADVLPTMQFAVDETRLNQNIWKEKIERQKSEEEAAAVKQRYKSEPRQSPLSGSPDRNPATSPPMPHPESLPAPGRSSNMTKSRPSTITHFTDDALQRLPIAVLPDHPADASMISCLPAGAASRSETEAVSANIHLAERSQPSASRNSHTSGQKDENVLAQLRLSTIMPELADSSAIENAPPDDFHASTSPSNEAALLDNSSASTAAGTRSSFGGGGGAGSSHRGDKSTESDTSTSQHTYSGNFSRPLSTRHSAHASYARSLAPSATATLASTYLPTSPADTQATSFFTEGSDGATDIHENMDLERHGSGYIGTITGNGFGNKVRSPTGKETKPGNVGGMLGHAETDAAVRKKPSRFRLDFWKKKKPGEVTNT